MTISTSARSALRLPYLAVRTPLGLLDDQVVCRVLGADSPVHRTLARGLRSLDQLAAATIAPQPARAASRPTAPAQEAAPEQPRPSAPARAAVPENPSDAIPAEPAPDRPQVEDLGAEEQQEIAERAEDYLAAEELEPHAGELAENEELRRVQAEIRAKQQIEDAHGQV